MICEECNKKNATVYINKNVSGKLINKALCTECAQKFRNAEKSVESESPQESRAEGRGEQREDKRQCPTCRLSLSSFEGSRDLTLGCPDCYKHFSSEIAKRLRFMRGELHYIGRSPLRQRREKKKAEYLDSLRAEMALAISNEDFERALTLREMIKSVS